MKYDRNGDTAWVRYHNSPANRGGTLHGLAVDRFGNVIVTGSSSRVYESDDYLTIKHAPDGDTLWSRRFAGQDNSRDISTAMAIDKLGECGCHRHEGLALWHS